MAKVFEISREDKENFVQALYIIFNLDRNYPDEEREFLIYLKEVMGIKDFQPRAFDNEEEGLAKVIASIHNNELLKYLSLLIVEIEEKQNNRELYVKKMRKVIERLPPELKSYFEVNSKFRFSTPSSNISFSKNKKGPINLSNIAGEFADIAGEKAEETLAFGKKLLGRLFK